MITPKSAAQRATTPSLEARNSPRTEPGTDFREEIVRGRERERADERTARGARDAASTRRDASPADSDVDAHDEQDLVDGSSSGEAAVSFADEPAPSAPVSQSARPPATATPESMDTASASRGSELPERTAALAAGIEPAAAGVGAHIAVATSFGALDPARDLEALMQAHAASGDDAPLELPTTSAPAARITPLGTSSPTSAPDVARLPTDQAAPRGMEIARDVAPSSAPIEIGSTTAIAGSVRSPAIAEVTPTSPTALPRLTPAEVPQFFETMDVRVDGSTNQAFVELEPPELGRLTIEISLQTDGGVRAEVRAERPDGYAALNSRIQEMRTSFLDRGFASADVQLSFGLAERDSRPGSDPRSPRRPRGGDGRALDTERVLALAAPRTGSIDVWA